MRLLVLTLALALTAAAQKKSAQPPPSTLDLSKLEPGLYTLINTSEGQIVAKLFEKETPLAVQNFIGLARGTKPWADAKRKVVLKPLYANLIFHRVIPDFMIQTGDPTETSGHDCGFVLPDEIRPDLNFDQPGRLGVANSGPNTGACQFFITDTQTPQLNGKYTIFGQVVEGLAVVKKISHVIRDEKDRPRIPTKLINVTFLRIAAKADAPKP